MELSLNGKYLKKMTLNQQAKSSELTEEDKQQYMSLK